MVVISPGGGLAQGFAPNPYRLPSETRAEGIARLQKMYMGAYGFSDQTALANATRDYDQQWYTPIPGTPANVANFGPLLGKAPPPTTPSIPVAPPVASVASVAPAPAPTPAAPTSAAAAPVQFPFQDWLDVNPEIAYQGALGGAGGPRSVAERNYFQRQFGNIQSQYMGALARAAQANPGVAPTQHFSDYLKNLDWTEQYYKASPEQRGLGQFNVPTTFRY